MYARLSKAFIHGIFFSRSLAKILYQFLNVTISFLFISITQIVCAISYTKSYLKQLSIDLSLRWTDSYLKQHLNCKGNSRLGPILWLLKWTWLKALWPSRMVFLKSNPFKFWLPCKMGEFSDAFHSKLFFAY